MSYDNYKKRVNFYGETDRERLLNQTKDNITKKSQESLSYKTISVNGDEQHISVTNKEKSFEKKFQSVPNEHLPLGSVFDWDNYKWIVCESDTDDELYQTGEIKQCNILLRWQRKDGTIISRWCYGANATKYSSGVDVTKIITTPDLQYNIIVPIDEETILLKRDKRFLIEDERFSESLRANEINPQSFKLTQVDVKTDSFSNIGGILNLTLTEDAFNAATDNTTLMIADYFSLPPQPSGNAEITYTGDPVVKLGLSKKFTAVFKGAEGEVIIGVTPIWTVNLLPIQENKVTYQINGDFITIGVVNDSTLVGTEFVLELDDEDGLYHGELTVVIRGLFG